MGTSKSLAGMAGMEGMASLKPAAGRRLNHPAARGTHLRQSRSPPRRPGRRLCPGTCVRPCRRPPAAAAATASAGCCHRRPAAFPRCSAHTLDRLHAAPRGAEAFSGSGGQATRTSGGGGRASTSPLPLSAACGSVHSFANARVKGSELSRRLLVAKRRWSRRERATAAGGLSPGRRNHMHKRCKWLCKCRNLFRASVANPSDVAANAVQMPAHLPQAGALASFPEPAGALIRVQPWRDALHPSAAPSATPLASEEGG